MFDCTESCPLETNRRGTLVKIEAGINGRESPHHCNASPDTSNLMSASSLPEARDSRMAARFAPASAIAAEIHPTAAWSGVPWGRRKIHGMLADVSERSDEIATTGTKDLTAICSAR